MTHTSAMFRATCLAMALAACTSDEGESADSGPFQLPDGGFGALVDSGAWPPAMMGLDSGLFNPGLSSDGGVRADGGSVGLTDAGLDAATDAQVADGSIDASSASDASRPDASSGDAGTGPCTGSATPHGCYKAKAGNDPNCPAAMPEQSAFYPPFEEWKGCASPAYQACVYLRPDGSEANCACDLGLHWLCTY